MTDDITFERFLSVLDGYVEEARLCVGNAQALLAACEPIDRLLSEEWPALQQQIAHTGITADQRSKLAEILATLSKLESKTLANIAWSDDLESYLRRDIEGAG